MYNLMFCVRNEENIKLNDQWAHLISYKANNDKWNKVSRRKEIIKITKIESWKSIEKYSETRIWLLEINI